MFVNHNRGNGFGREPVPLVAGLLGWKVTSATNIYYLPPGATSWVMGAALPAHDAGKIWILRGDTNVYMMFRLGNFIYFQKSVDGGLNWTQHPFGAPGILLGPEVTVAIDPATDMIGYTREAQGGASQGVHFLAQDGTRTSHSIGSPDNFTGFSFFEKGGEIKSGRQVSPDYIVSVMPVTTISGPLSFANDNPDWDVGYSFRETNHASSDTTRHLLRPGAGSAGSSGSVNFAVVEHFIPGSGWGSSNITVPAPGTLIVSNSVKWTEHNNGVWFAKILTLDSLGTGLTSITIAISTDLSAWATTTYGGVAGDLGAEQRLAKMGSSTYFLQPGAGAGAGLYIKSSTDNSAMTATGIMDINVEMIG